MLALVLGFCVFLLATLPALRAADGSSWEALRALAPGTQLHVVHGELKAVRGTLAEVRSDALVVRTASGDLRLPRDSVLRVSLPGTARRGRNALIGAAIGGAAALTFGWIALEVGDADIRRDIILIPFSGLGAGIGAGLGAAVSANRTVYRAPASARKP